MPYDPRAIEAKWQARWAEDRVFETSLDTSKPKYYVLDMFPYPSGSGLHVGHPKGYIATDVISRYKRMRGFNVLHPMGWDAFGLPAEQYAIETGTHPRDTTRKNIAKFKSQLSSLGLDYDWSREINTTDPRYFKWTQWIFCKLYERGLAYLAEVPVNWCAALGTVLSNEEVIDGKSERGGHPVVRVPMRQWMLRITAYADRLIDDLDEVDWPEAIKKMQRDWIGRSEGARILFDLDGHEASIEVFTTRPDTLYGATYMVLAPEHPRVAEITAPAQKAAVDAYADQTARRSERARMAETHDKSGVFTGAHALHPVTGAKLPVWIADYVLASYGTGAIMAVPAHDTRDHEFATRFGLPIVEVVSGGADVQAEAFVGEGAGVNSDFLDGLATPDAKRKMGEWLKEHGRGEPTVNFKLRDWLFSRQRYWGEPFPVIHRKDGSTHLIPESELPLELPETEDFKPSGEFEPPLARIPEWLETTDPDTGEPVLRDANTMPQWAGSCWYYLRFVDPSNDAEPWSKEAERYWMPVDLYVGGAEHAVLHLMYARFWHKVLYDLGLVHTKEPFQRLLNPGMILGYSYRYYDDDLLDEGDAGVQSVASSEVVVDEDTTRHRETGAELKVRWVKAEDVRWVDEKPLHPTLPDLPLEEVTEKMSKSRGNVVNPDDVVDRWGTDTMRLYEMFMGPIEKGAPWSDESIPGLYRFLQRTWRLFLGNDGALMPLADGAGTAEQARLTARTIQGVTDDLENIRFNTAISKLMVFSREIAEGGPLPREATERFALLLAPFAPHLAEELWQALGHPESLARAPWPEADPDHLVEDTVTLVVQVNGKRRDELQVPSDADSDAIQAAALALEKVQRHLGGREPRKVIVVPGRLVNVVG
jgi:leucyl-tRNA synthetase